MKNPKKISDTKMPKLTRKPENQVLLVLYFFYFRYIYISFLFDVIIFYFYPRAYEYSPNFTFPNVYLTEKTSTE